MAANKKFKSTRRVVREKVERRTMTGELFKDSVHVMQCKMVYEFQEEKQGELQLRDKKEFYGSPELLTACAGTVDSSWTGNILNEEEEEENERDRGPKAIQLTQ